MRLCYQKGLGLNIQKLWIDQLIVLRKQPSYRPQLVFKIKTNELFSETTLIFWQYIIKEPPKLLTGNVIKDFRNNWQYAHWPIVIFGCLGTFLKNRRYRLTSINLGIFQFSKNHWSILLHNLHKMICCALRFLSEDQCRVLPLRHSTNLFPTGYHLS